VYPKFSFNRGKAVRPLNRETFRQAVQVFTTWFYDMQKHCFLTGQPLSERQCRVARLCGVTDPGKVRILFVPEIEKFIPGRVNMYIDWQIKECSVPALAAGHGLLIRESHRDRRCLRRHKFYHIAEFEKNSIEWVVRKYLSEAMASPIKSGRMIKSPTSRCIGLAFQSFFPWTKSEEALYVKGQRIDRLFDSVSKRFIVDKTN